MTFEVKLTGKRENPIFENISDLDIQWKHYLESKEDKVIESDGYIFKLSDVRWLRRITNSRTEETEENEIVPPMTPEQRTMANRYFAECKELTDKFTNN